MRIGYQRCCGLDVHKNSITACLLLIDDDGGGEFRTHKREFGDLRSESDVVLGGERGCAGHSDGSYRSLLETRKRRISSHWCW
jgi:hypothetical protein